MVHLSPRLQQAAELVDNGALLADIGCGHGKLCLYCLQRGVVSSAIAVDCSAPSLATAGLAAQSMGLQLDCRLGNGLAPVNADEVTCAVIAGMGGYEMVGILSRAAYCVPSLVLVPHKNAELVRKYLWLAHYRVVYDAVVPDGRFWYSVIKACATADTRVADVEQAAALTGARWYVGKDNYQNPHYEEYRRFRLQRLQQLRQQGAVDVGIDDEIRALTPAKGD